MRLRNIVSHRSRIMYHFKTLILYRVYEMGNPHLPIVVLRGNIKEYSAMHWQLHIYFQLRNFKFKFNFCIKTWPVLCDVKTLRHLHFIYKTISLAQFLAREISFPSHLDVYSYAYIVAYFFANVRIIHRNSSSNSEDVTSLRNIRYT